MSENDKDPQQGEFTDPTASPDWTAPQSSQEPTPQEPAPPEPEAPQAPEAPQPPQSAPTEQIPQGGDTQASPQGQPAPPVPPAPSYDAPYVQPRGESNPYAGSSAQPTNPYAATPPPPPHDPYAAPQPAYDPYAASGAQAQPGGYPPYQAPYQAPGQWQAPPAAYGAPPPQNTSALVLTIVSGLALVSCCNIFVIPSLVLGIMGLTKNNEDPVGARRLTKYGWIGFAIAIALVVIGAIIFFAVGAAGGFDGGSYDSDYSY